MAENKGMRRYTIQESMNLGMGQVGSIFIDSTSPQAAPTGHVYVAITMVNDAVFESTDGLINSSNNEFMNSTGVTDWGVGQAIGSLDIFPAGLTIYGRWRGIHLASGKVIAYIGT